MAYARAGKRSYTEISDSATSSAQSLRIFPKPDNATVAGPPLLVVGLDQGTAFTGYAMCPYTATPTGGFSLDHLKRLKDVIATGEVSGPIAAASFGDRPKGPSLVAMETLTNFHARAHRGAARAPVREFKFGADAQVIAADFAAARLADHAVQPKFDVFSDFKRPLHPSARGAMAVADVTRMSVTGTGAKIRCVDAVSLINGACIARALKQYNQAHPERPATLRNVRVVAAHPNEWDDAAVSAVRHAILCAAVEYREGAATKVGQVLPDNVVQVPESVAAFISLALQAALEHAPDVVSATSADDAARLKELLHPGMVILCCDAGAGTVDITVNVVQSLSPFVIKEVVYSRGQDVGGSMVEDAFMVFFKRQLERLGVQQKHWDANPLVEYTLRAHFMTLKTLYDPQEEHDQTPFLLDVESVQALFPTRPDTWWTDVGSLFQDLGSEGKRQKDIIIRLPDQSLPIVYRQGNVDGSFSKHAFQAHGINIPRRFVHTLLNYNAERILEFTLDVVRKINETPLAPVNASSSVGAAAASSSSSSSSAPAGNFKVDAIFLTGQGTVSTVHRDMLQAALKHAELAPGQAMRKFVYPTGFSMHVSRGAVMHSMLGTQQIRRRLQHSYGVRLRHDDEAPWKAVGMTKEEAQTAGVLYKDPDLIVWSIDYIAPFAQRGAEVLANAPYFLEHGTKDTLKLAAGMEYNFDVYSVPDRMNAFSSGSPLHVVSRTNASMPGTRVVRECDVLARVTINSPEYIEGRPRFTFASEQEGVISCAIEGHTGKDVSAMRVVPGTVQYNHAPKAAAAAEDDHDLMAQDGSVDDMGVFEVDDDDDAQAPIPPPLRRASTGGSAAGVPAAIGKGSSSLTAATDRSAFAAPNVARGPRARQKGKPKPWGVQK